MNSDPSNRAAAPSSLARTAASFRLVDATITRAELASRLPLGASLTARVLEAPAPGQYIIGIAGLKLAAESALDLPPGARVGVRVAGHDPRVQLRILGPEAGGLADALKGLGFDRPTPTMREGAEELMRQGLPLTRETLRRAGDGMARGLTARAAVALVRHDLPLTDATAARAAAAGDSIARAFAALEGALKAAGRDTDAARIRDALTFRGDLGSLFESHPLKLERRLLADVVTPERPEVKPMLETLARAPESASAAERDAANAARSLLEALEGRYLVGNPERAIPFVVEDDGLRDASIAAERTAGHTHVTLRLETSRLGAVVGLVDSVRRGVGIALGVENAEARQALLAAVPDLSERLRALGFHLDGLTVDVLDPDRGATSSARPALGLDLKA